MMTPTLCTSISGQPANIRRMNAPGPFHGPCLPSRVIIGLVYILGLLLLNQPSAAAITCSTAMQALPAVGADPAFSSIRLRESARLTGANLTQVHLGEIADLRGDMAAALAQTVIAPIPNPSKPMTISITTVRQVLRDAGVNMGLLALSGGECVIRCAPEPDTGSRASTLATGTGPEATKASAPVAVISDEEQSAAIYVRETTLRGAVARYVISNMLGGIDPSEVRLTFQNVTDDQLMTDGHTIDFEVAPLAAATSTQIPVEVHLFRGHRQVDTVRLTVAATVRQTVLIMNHYKRRGETLTADDVRTETQYISPYPGPALSDESQMAGRESRGKLVPGQILREGDLVLPVSIKRNQDVSVVVRIGRFVIRMPGKALDEGRTGDMVRVKRMNDNVVMNALVDERGELIVDPTSPDAVGRDRN